MSSQKPKPAFQGLAVATLLAAVALAGAGAAQAGCTDYRMPMRPASLFKSINLAQLSNAVYRPGQPGAAGSVQVSYGQNEDAAIVGLWKFEMRVDSDQFPFSSGDLLDYGLAAWHDDGTEITFSGGRPPSAGDVCMGAWRQAGRNRFKLNHVALGLALGGPDAGKYVGPVAIREIVNVDPSGNSFTGRFTLTQYLGTPSATPWTEFDQSTALPVGQGSFSGTITAIRVTPDE